MNRLLHHWISEQAARSANACAIVHGATRITYGDLDAESNRLAQTLISSGVRPGDRVCLLMPKSPAAIIAIIGALKAGAIYVPLDTASPAARLVKIIASCDQRWLLACGRVSNLLTELWSSRGFAESHAVGWLDRDGLAAPVAAEFSVEDVATQPDAEPAIAESERSAAHILFTSGSTGTPKGVVVTHSSVRHFIEWAVSYFGTSSSDRISGHPPLHFDLSTFDMFGTFAAGAQLHLVPAEMNLLPHKLAEFIRRSQLTQWFSVPSVLAYMTKFDAVRDGDFPSLRRVLWCGDVLPSPVLSHWMQRVPHAQFTNLYGPTEAAIASSYYTVPRLPGRDDEPVPIGRACDGEELLVLDAERRPAQIGDVGDLYIGGVGLSPGYWRDEEKTAAAFVSHTRGTAPPERIYRTGDLARVDEHGLVHFVGRADSQIKTRGYRVELGEVEFALHALNTLRECAVVAVPSDGFDGTAICCAYVPVAPGTPSGAQLRDACARTLPSYMLPSRWFEFDELPKTSNGKIDRRAIRERFADLPAPAMSGT